MKCFSGLRLASWTAFAAGGACAAGRCAAASAPAAIVIARVASTDTLVASWVRGFEAAHPGIPVRQTSAMTDLPAKALQELIGGEVQVAPFVREIQPEELAAAKQTLGYEPLGLAIASGSYATPSNTHAIAVYVHASNPLRRLTLAQLDAIYSASRRRGFPTPMRTWGQLGLGGVWKDRPVHAYGMVIRRKVGNPHAGIVAYLMQRVLLGAEFDPSTRQVPDTGMGRGNNRALDEIADAVAADPDAIGYAGFANRRPGTRSVALAETDAGPYYEGTQDEVARRVYPLTRTIFVFVRRPVSPEIRAFLDYILSPAGQEAVAADPAHFLPLPPAMAGDERAKLAAASN